jgi:nucleotide-binding universal stress UspA family protein
MTNTIVGQPIVAGVDGSDSALRAARWAATEASARHIPLRLVHALGMATFGYAGWSSPPEGFYDDLKSSGQQDLVQVETALGQSHPGLAVELDLRIADPAPMLITESDTARMVVVGSRGLGGFRGALVGSTAVALAIRAHCPVAVIRGRTPEQGPPSDGPVVVGVDGSPASEPALALAFDEASWRGAELAAVHTWIEAPDERFHTHARSWVADWEGIETRAREELAERLAGWQEKYPDVTVRRVVTRDPPVRGLLEQSAEAQLLVVGSRGRNEVAGMLLGSTSLALLHHGSCPLLVVPSAAVS